VSAGATCTLATWRPAWAAACPQVAGALRRLRRRHQTHHTSQATATGRTIHALPRSTSCWEPIVREHDTLLRSTRRAPSLSSPLNAALPAPSGAVRRETADAVLPAGLRLLQEAHDELRDVPAADGAMHLDRLLGVPERLVSSQPIYATAAVAFTASTPTLLWRLHRVLALAVLQLTR